MSIITRLVLAIAIATIAVPTATACAPGARIEERATGTVVAFASHDDAVTVGARRSRIVVQYPAFSGGKMLYMHSFDVRTDARVRGMRAEIDRQLAAGAQIAHLGVQLARVGDDWRVVSFSASPSRVSTR
jgi:hypothetical protein